MIDGDGASMKNNTINRIFANLDKLIDGYTDLPDTIEAEDRFWEYVNANCMKDADSNGKVKLENVLYGMASCKEKQGFLYGFNFAMDLMGRGNG